MTTGYGSAVRSAAVSPGEDVAVIGIGGVGVAALQGARLAGARRIFAVDPYEWKREQALKFGATAAFADVGSAAASIADATRGTMCHKVIVTVGHVEGKDVESWMGLTAKGGVCCHRHGKRDGQRRHPEPCGTLAVAEKLAGQHLWRRQPSARRPVDSRTVPAGATQPRRHVTREYTLEQINDGYRDMLEGRNVRGIIRYTDADRV